MSELFPFLSSWGCLLLGMHLEIKYRQGWRGGIAMLAVMASIAAVMYWGGSHLYVLSFVGYLVGLAAVLLYRS